MEQQNNAAEIALNCPLASRDDAAESIPADLPLTVLAKPMRMAPPYYWVEHIPFAFHLVAALKPAAYLELGVRIGNSYSAFCQAVRLTGFDTQCTGVDNWSEIELSADSGVAEAGREFENLNHREFFDFSNLLRTSYETAIRSFPDDAVDLLHFNAQHGSELTPQLFDAIRPKMKANGIILFSETVSPFAYPDSGTLWKTLPFFNTTLAYRRSARLSLIFLGDPAQSALQPYLNNAGFIDSYQQFFAHLGDSLLLETAFDEERKTCQREMRNATGKLERTLTTLREKMNHQEQAVDARVLFLENQTRVAKEERAIVIEKMRALEARDKEIEKRDEDLRQAAASFNIEKEAIVSRALDLEEALRVERARFASQLAEAENQKELLRGQLNALQSAVSDGTLDLKSQITALQSQLDQLIRSKSWKLTEPLRRFAALVK